MDPLRAGELELRLQHRHDNGSWGSFARRPREQSSADLDPEREWANGVIFACTTCDEKVRIIHDREESATD